MTTHVDQYLRFAQAILTTYYAVVPQALASHNPLTIGLPCAVGILEALGLVPPEVLGIRKVLTAAVTLFPEA